MNPRVSHFFRRIFTATLLLLLILFVSTGCTAAAKKARYLSRADDYFKKGEYEKAKIEYVNVLRVDPQNIVAIQRLGTIWFEEGSVLRALPFLLGSKQLAPDQLDVRTKLGMAQLSVGQFAEARAEATAILKKDPRHGEAILLLADSTLNAEELAANQQTLLGLPDHNTPYFLQAEATLAMRSGQLTTAQASLERAQKLDPKMPSIHLGLATLALFNKDTTKAAEEFKIADQLSPPRSVAKLKHADFKISSGARDEGKAILTDITRRAPDYLPAWQMQAQLASTEKNYDASLALLEHIFSQDNDNLEARTLQAENLLAKNETKKAVETLERLDRFYKSVPLVKLQLARAYLQDNNRSQAIIVLTQAIDLAPDFADAILLLSDLQINGGEAKIAVTALTDLLKKQPTLVNAAVMLANAYLTLGRFAEGETLLTEVIKSKPPNPQALLLLGLAQRQQNKLTEARATFNTAHEISPDDLTVLFQLVDLDLTQKDYAAALQKVQAQMKTTPNSAAAYYLEARVFAAQADWDHTEASLLKALELDPNFTYAYDLLISTYVTTNKLAPALAELDGLLAKSPTNPRALMMSAMIYTKQNHLEKARDSYEKLLAASPDFVAALNNLACLYNENLNQPDKAYDLAQRAHSLRPNEPTITDTLGWVLYKRADYQQALGFLQEAAAKLPNEPELQYHFGMASYMMGQEDAARSALQAANASTADFSGKAEIPARLSMLGKDGSASALTSGDLEAKVKQNPNDLLALVQLGAVYEKEQSWTKAESAYQRALQANPRLLAANEHLARLYAGPLPNPTKAQDLAKTAHELAPNDAHISALLGRLTLQSGNYVLAYSLLRDSARELTKDPAVQRDFGLAAYYLGNADEARGIMQRIVNAGADAQETRDASQFLSLTAPDQTPQALASLEPEARKALQADPQYTPALMVSAALNTQHGDTKAAIDTYEKILLRAPDFVPAQKKLAGLYLRNVATRDQAYDLAVKARKAVPNDPEVAESLGEASYYRKQYDYARQLLQESERKRPLNNEALFCLGMAYLQNKQTAQGQETLEKALAAGLSEPLTTEAKQALAKAAASK